MATYIINSINQNNHQDGCDDVDDLKLEPNSKTKLNGMSNVDVDGDLEPDSNSNLKKTFSIHPVGDIPTCKNCSPEEYFNFSCPDCFSLISDEKTNISQLIAIARQWNPDIQNNMDLLIRQMIQKGAHANDRDELTDMTLLHFACKSGTEGMGNAEKCLKLVIYLIEQCQADPNLLCKWNDMSALHIAAYYDIAPVLGYLVTIENSSMIDYPSKCLESQTPLHIAASNLNLKSVRILLSSGANVLLKDNHMRTPLDCVPEDFDENLSWFEGEKTDISLETRTILEEATLVVSGESNSPDAECMKTAKVVLSALGLEIGDKVLVGNQKIGTLRYCGPTQFATGIWTGIELDEPIGKNDGSVDGVRYFVCASNYGLFAPINRISKLESDDFDLMMNHSFDSKQSFSKSNSGPHSLGYNFMNVQSKIDTGLDAIANRSSDANLLSSSRSSVNSEDIVIGCKVYLIDKKTGIVRFIGTTKFAPGIWYGIELTQRLGKNDGSVQGVQYFKCKDCYGVFVPFSRIAGVLPNHKKKKNSSLFSPGNVSESDDSDFSLTMSGTSSLDLYQFNKKSLNSLERNDGKPTIRRSMSLSKNIYTPGNLGRRSRVSIKPLQERSWLRVGVNALVNGMVGTVRYIGPIHCSDGTFLGIELRNPMGKNDGSIDGKRYFTCKPNHGLLVRPNKVTIRGINASKLLLSEEQENKKN